MLADFWLTEWARRGTGVNSQWAHSEAKLHTGPRAVVCADAYVRRHIKVRALL